MASLIAMGKWKWKWNILIVLGYVRIQTIKVHIIDKKALGWNSTHLILAIYRMVGKPTIWVEIQHAPMTMWLWGWGFKPVLAQCVPHSCHEGTTHRRLNWRGRLFSLLQPFPPSLLGEGRHFPFVVCQILMNISEYLTNCDGKVKVKLKYINSSWLCSNSNN